MRMKTRMLRIAGDMPGLFRGRMGCRACSPLSQGEEGPEEIETMEHLKECEGYKHLRDDDIYADKGLINYFLRVMKERANMEK